jgi:hypothetical protein
MRRSGRMSVVVVIKDSALYFTTHNNVDIEVGNTIRWNWRRIGFYDEFF